MSGSLRQCVLHRRSVILNEVGLSLCSLYAVGVLLHSIREALRHFGYFAGVAALWQLLAVDEGLLPGDELVFVRQLGHGVATAKRMPAHKLEGLGVDSAHLIADVLDGVVAAAFSINAY